MSNNTDQETQTRGIMGDVKSVKPVSYTHLTLPTNREV